MNDLQVYIDEIVRKAKSMKGVSFRLPYGPDVLSIEIIGKQFCLIDLSKKWDFYNLKCQPELSEKLRWYFSGIRPGFHMNKTHWNSVDFDGDCPMALQYMLLRHAYLQTLKGLAKKDKTALYGSSEAFDTKYEKQLSEISKFLEKTYL